MYTSPTGDTGGGEWRHACHVSTYTCRMHGMLIPGTVGTILFDVVVTVAITVGWLQPSYLPRGP